MARLAEAGGGGALLGGRVRQRFVIRDERPQESLMFADISVRKEDVWNVHGGFHKDKTQAEAIECDR